MGRFVVFLGTVLVALAVAQVPKEKPSAVSLANRFLDALSAEQRKVAMKPFEDDYRTRWNFVPIHREGINLGELSSTQVKLGEDLLKFVLSPSGFRKTETIKTLEDVLFELENGNKGRDKRLYTFTFFGTPSAEGKWGWRYEGHHVSLNYTYRGNELISSTPQFFGANPAEVRSGAHKGLIALPEEQDVAFAFLNTLKEDQMAKALLPGPAPAEIVTSNARKVAIMEKAGIPMADLKVSQQISLMRLIKLHAVSQSVSEFKRRLDRVDASTVVFAWMGSTKPGQGHYYRIQGSKFLIEYDNTQNDANHIHAVWRDFDGDFGEDLLAEHYASK